MRASSLLAALFKRGGPGPTLEGAQDALRTEFTLARIDAHHVARYNALLGFSGAQVPLTYYYLLTQRAHLATLLAKGFPFRVAGMIHVENTLTELRQPDLDRPLHLRTTVAISAPSASGAVHCELLTEALQDDATIFRCASTYLARQGKRKAAHVGIRDAIEGKRIGGWAVGGSLGRAYARVSGDWNPIHLWRWSARLMGLRRPIIHGMHSVAAACALLEQTTARRVTAVSARFKAPIALRARPTLYISGDHHRYCIGLEGRRVVDGSVTLA